MENSCEQKYNEKYDKEQNQVAVVYPVVLGSPETTLRALDSDSENSECQEWCREVFQNNLVVPQTPTINVEHSTDVVIGPLTQFHGPVTIYQNINRDIQTPQENLSVEYKSDVVVHPAKPATPENNSPEKHHPILKFIKTHYKRLAIYATIVFAMLSSIVVGLVVSLNITSNPDGNTDNHSVIGELNKTVKEIGPHKLFSREDWKAKPSIDCEVLYHPTEYVIIAHTAGKVCSDFQKCFLSMQQIQTWHFSQNNKQACRDIWYNFVIGGDGNIYVGRGWDIKNSYGDNSISITFTGDYSKSDQLTPHMISALKDLLALGVELKKLPRDYKLVCHNQVFPTASPGKNVIQEIVKFPNYYPHSVKLNVTK